jgi:uncharacterized protein with FMN-binding domain
MTDKIQSFISSALVFGALALIIVTPPVRANGAKHPARRRLNTVFIPRWFNHYAAGNYTFSTAGASAIIQLRDHATGNRICAAAIADEENHRQKGGAIAFARYGSEYFLRRVDAPNSSRTYKCIDNEQENAVSRVMQTKNATQVTVTAEPILSK